MTNVPGTIAERYAYIIEYSLSGAGNTLEGLLWPREKQVNNRVGGKIEVRDGSYMLLDPDNTAGEYQFYGKIKGHWSVCPIESTLLGGAKQWFPCTWTTYKDILYLTNGFMIPWPGVGPRSF